MTAVQDIAWQVLEQLVLAGLSSSQKSWVSEQTSEIIFKFTLEFKQLKVKTNDLK